MVDLHTHSNISDGELSPEKLIEEAVKLKLRAIALTDHDTINGLEIAKNAAKQHNIYLIPGIEINIDWNGSRSGHDVPGLGPGGEFHLLGLGINSPSQAFIAAVDELARRREARNREILNRMCELSLIKVSEVDEVWEELKKITGVTGIKNSMGRPHFAAFLIRRKIVTNVKQAFSRYLGAGKPLYVPKAGLIFSEAVSLIRESGGLPILAHPISLFVAWGRLPGLIKSLKDMGLMGLEAWHPTAKQNSCRRLESLAQSLGLYITEGSDFHGSLIPDRKLGYSSKGRRIKESILESIPELFDTSNF